MSQLTNLYTHGHHESVLRAHNWRTVSNSVAYLMDSLQPGMSILDIGCGPGSITIDFAKYVQGGKVVGLESTPEPLNTARALAEKKGVQDTVSFVVGDAHHLPFEDKSFDVVHAHQVLQHVADPIQVLKEMQRVAKTIVACRETDFKATAWFPPSKGLDKWSKSYMRTARLNGGEPEAGRQLRSWARKAGYDTSKINSSAGTWCYATPEEVKWWSAMWADRTLQSDFARSAVEKGVLTREDLEEIAKAWGEWGDEEDAWFAMLHGEILCRV